MKLRGGDCTCKRILYNPYFYTSVDKNLNDPVCIYYSYILYTQFTYVYTYYVVVKCAW